MLATAAKLTLVTAILVLFAPSADAQRIHPRCTKAKDKVKCTCGLDNGGAYQTRPGGMGRRLIIRQAGQPVNDGYARCMIRNGRS